MPARIASKPSISTGKLIQTAQIVACVQSGIDFGVVEIRERDFVQEQLLLKQTKPVGDDPFPKTRIEPEANPGLFRSFHASG